MSVEVTSLPRLSGLAAGVAPLARHAAVSALALLLVTGIVALDVRTGPEISLAVLYLAPIVLASWLSGSVSGIGIALAGSLAWFFWDPSENARLEPVPLWNLAARLGIFSLVAAVIGTLRASIERERRSLEAVRRFNDHLDAQVKERTESLRRSVGELEVFTYTMAHDLRAPLRAMHGFTDLLLQEHAAALPGEAQALLARVAGASRKMDHLVLDLLDYGSLIHKPVELRPVALEPIGRAAVESARGRFPEPGADVQVEGPLPSVLGDVRLLGRVLEELLDNAIRYAAPGRGARIRLRGGRSGDRAFVLVEDNGVGIPPEHRHRIFQPFQQLGPPTDDGGTGMGLAVARKAVERMNGSIEVDSRPGEGSVFRVELRAADAQGLSR